MRVPALLAAIVPAVVALAACATALPGAAPTRAPVAPPVASPPIPAGTTNVPLAIVQGYYAALARGDGQTAVAFVAPKNRGPGAFDAVALTQYYTNMREPLRVLGVGRLDADAFRVRYSYTQQSGRRCNGAADVLLAHPGGATFIDRIHTLSGC